MQGVGFRPYVYQLATQLKLNGQVNNTSDGVHIEINGFKKETKQFYQTIISAPPPLAIIQQHTIQQIPAKHFHKFSIIESKSKSQSSLMLTPDYALCIDCKTEMQDKNNRRYHYPFITCTQCGPRYSIIHRLPYDRAATSMETFAMCAACKEEYNNPADRRFFSQTNSCNNCGISIQLYNQHQTKLSTDTTVIIEQIITELANGKIVAVKGIGGYLLLCDATNQQAIQLLRQRKHRPTKPFAVMYPKMELLAKDVLVNEVAKSLLQSAAAPILLLPLQETNGITICSNYIAPGLLKLGVLLPYTPIFKMILNGFGKPVVATSGNINEASIVYEDAIALQQLSPIADFIVTNNRAIILPQDDSVVQLTALKSIQIILRRSRGLAPSYFGYTSTKKNAVFASGALLKSSCCYMHQGNVFISQYLGNTDGYDAQLSYEKTVNHFFNFFNSKPDVVIADKHPNYFSHQFAKQLSNHLQIPFIQVQHHKAHFAAVLAEHNLLQIKEPVLGIIWDGVGLGDDGNSWGGEFFIFEKNAMQRRYHFDYFPIIAGDKMAREPRLSALSVCSEVWMAEELLQAKFTVVEWQLYQKIIVAADAILCSSVGRIFDAVASLLNLCNKQSYEGEAALLVEQAAQQYFNANGYIYTDSYFMDGAHFHKIPTATLFSGIISDIKKGKATAYIAARFHYSLVHIIKIIAGNLQLSHLAFSGGVFQNSLLVDLLQYHLGKSHQLYFHKQLSPNDENISFGQMVYYDNGIDTITILEREKITENKTAQVPAEN